MGKTNYSVSVQPVTGHEGEMRAYATSQFTESLDLNQFAEHISLHQSIYGRDVVAGVLMKAVDCMQELLLDSKQVVLGDLGAFRLTILNKPYTELPETAGEYRTNQHIQSLNVVWRKGERFRHLLQKAEFNLVATRQAQAATLAAEKAGLQTVDLSKNTTSSGTGSSSGGSSSDTGGSDTGGGGVGGI